MVVLGGLLAILVSGASVALFRETLHYNCSWGLGGEWGESGSWVCADGIGYLVVAVGLGGMSALVLLIGLLIAFARPSLRRTVTYLALATVSLGWVGWWSLYSSTAYTGQRPEGETGAGLWAATVLPGLAVCILGLLVGAAGCLTRRRWSPIAYWTGIGLITIGTMIQPGIGVATFVSAGILAAAGYSQPTAR